MSTEDLTQLRQELHDIETLILPHLDGQIQAQIHDRLMLNKKKLALDALKKRRADQTYAKTRDKKMRDLRTRVADLEEELQAYKVGARAYRGTMNELHDRLKKQERLIMEYEIRLGIVKVEV